MGVGQRINTLQSNFTMLLVVHHRIHVHYVIVIPLYARFSKYCSAISCSSFPIKIDTPDSRGKLNNCVCNVFLRISEFFSTLITNYQIDF